MTFLEFCKARVQLKLAQVCSEEKKKKKKKNPGSTLFVVIVVVDVFVITNNIKHLYFVSKKAKNK